MHVEGHASLARGLLNDRGNDDVDTLLSLSTVEHRDKQG